MTTAGRDTGRHSVSVLLASYNQPNALRLALAGFRAQDDPDFELLIADDGSQPDLRDVIEDLLDDLPFPVHFLTQADDGFRKARILNSALLRAKGRQIILVDGDCVPFRDLVSTHRHAFREGTFCAGGFVRLTLEQSRALTPEMIARGDHERYLRGHAWRRMRWVHFKNGLYRVLGKKWKPKAKGLNFSADREALLAIDGFDEAFEGMSGFDSDMRNRLRSSGARGISLWHSAFVCHLDHALDPRRSTGIARRPRDRTLYYGRRGHVKALKGLSTHDPGGPDAHELPATKSGEPLYGYRIVRGSITAEQAEALAWIDSKDAVPGNLLLARGNTRQTVLLSHLKQVWKRHHRIGSREKWQALRGDTFVRREFDNTARALEMGLPVPRPLFAAERRRLGVLTGQVIAFEHIENGLPLGRALGLRERDGPDALDAEDRLDLLRRCGALLAEMHSAGVRHRDLGPGNLMITRSGGTATLWALDWLTAEFSEPQAREDDRSELLRVAAGLRRTGVPLGELRVLHTAYCDALGWRPDRRLREVRWLLAGLRADRERIARRTVRYATEAGRRHVQRALPDGRVLHAFRTKVDTAADALSAPNGERPEGVQVRDDAEAVETWRAACLYTRFTLPCRHVLGIAVRGRRAAGQLVLEETAGAPLEPELQQPATREAALDDLRRLLVLLHSFGLRFRDCAPGTIGRSGAADPVAAVRARGLTVQEPAALRARPGSETGPSWSAVAAYVASQCGAEEGAAFTPRRTDTD